jgi:hypothetical protein
LGNIPAKNARARNNALTIIGRGGIRQQLSWLGGVAWSDGKMLPEVYFWHWRRALCLRAKLQCALYK